MTLRARGRSSTQLTGALELRDEALVVRLVELVGRLAELVGLVEQARVARVLQQQLHDALAAAADRHVHHRVAFLRMTSHNKCSVDMLASHTVTEW